MRAVKSRLSYANVMSTIAVFIALGGTAAAVATLPANSVGSKQIINNKVKSKDLKNNGVKSGDVKDQDLTGADVADGGIAGADLAADSVDGTKIADGAVGGADIADGAITGADVGDDSLTGADLDESTLGTVPNASQLGGFAPSAFPRSGGSAFSDTFSEGDPLELDVPGYGQFVLFCDDNNTTGTPGDDLVTYGYGHSLGAGATNGERAWFTNAPTVPGETFLFNHPATNTFAQISAEDDRVQVEQLLRSANGDKAIRVSAWGWDDNTSTTDCIGMIEAQILR